MIWLRFARKNTRSSSRLSSWLRDRLISGFSWPKKRAFTLGYFVPTMVRLMQTANSPDAAASATQWAQLNNVRHLLVLAAWLAALKTFSSLYTQRK